MPKTSNSSQPNFFLNSSDVPALHWFLPNLIYMDYFCDGKIIDF